MESPKKDMCRCKQPIVIKQWDNTRGKVTFCGKCGKDIIKLIQEVLL